MKCSEAWLRSEFDPGQNTEHLVKQLTMAGLEVGAVEPVAPAFSDVIIGEVLKVRSHPNADRLKVCEVSIGDDQPVLSIVCGAANVASELKVAVALVGAELPNNFTIAARKVRGEASQGMLCSAEELGLAQSSDGIMELPEDAPVGKGLRVYLQLDDVCIDIELTPNRSDCLSVRGVARELAVLNETEWQLPDYASVPASHQQVFPVYNEALEACPIYLGRVIRSVGQGQTPIQVQERLRRSGIRPINPVVDATQYVMLALGQPMHAFDLQELNQQISIRFAHPEESLELLDGQVIELNSKSLVIADAKGPVALAGVMGGHPTSVQHRTRDVFLECAVFDPGVMAGLARSFGLHTEASHRFERGIDPRLCHQAMEYATRLIVEWTGGEPGPLIESAHHIDHWPIKQIALPWDQIVRLLGFEWSADWVAQTLTRLGCSVQQGEAVWLVEPPSWRHDLVRDVDLIEELARVYGYHRLPSRSPAFPLAAPLGQVEAQFSLKHWRNRLISLGYQEVVNYSFIDPALQQLVDPKIMPFALENPISADMSVMRTSLWPGLLANLAYNQHRQTSELKLFESGVCFLPSQDNGNKPQEISRIAGLWSGARAPVGWQSSPEPADFFDMKGDIEQLLSFFGKSVTFLEGAHAALHPYQSVHIHVNGEKAGWLGKLHPSLLKKFSIEGNVYLFELIYKRIGLGKLPTFQVVSKYPEVKRDIAMLFPVNVTVSDIMQTIEGLSLDDLQDTVLFDVYQGEGVPSGMKSLAFSLRFQHPDKTLTDTEITDRTQKLVAYLANHLQAVLRD